MAKRTLRIGMLAPIAWRVPPRHYGPWERVVSLLSEGLVERGVEVTLFATADSVTRARLDAVCPRPYEEDPHLDPKVWECLHIANAWEKAAKGEFDLLHNHYDFLPLSYRGLTQLPMVTTIHGFSSEQILPVYQAYNDRCHYVSISNADRHPRLEYLATVYHGIAMDEFHFRAEPDDYLVVFGRIHPDKGVAEAIQAAKSSQQRLVIAGIIQDRAYFGREVAPHIDGEWVKYVGSVGPVDRDTLLGGAKGLLHLVNFDEPFGLSMVEAMACGTPVIATRLGSVPEVVKDGESGLIVSSLDEAVDAINHLDQIDRRQTRQYASDRFSVERMVSDYLDVYQRVLKF